MMKEDKVVSKKTHVIYLASFVILASIILSFSFQHHKKHDWEIWKAENFADQGGYFIYNPIWFQYGYESANFPEKSDSLLGGGFDLSGPIIKDKYTCGVAYLQVPFYLWMRIDAGINHRTVKLSGSQTKRYIDVAAVFYLLMGSICLYFLMVRFFKPWICFVSICLVVAGTNVIYYAIYHPGMSHIYSFFLYSVTLLLADTFFQKKKKWMLVLLSLTAACIVLIRPTNILFLPSILFIRGSVKEKLLLLIQPVHIAIMVVSTVLVFIPQMYYWYLFSGKFIYYSYSQEGFTHLKDPVFIRVLFAPENGLIPYSLIFVLLLIANIYAVIKKQAFAIYYLFYQILALYLIASWHAPGFGASYGQRNFVEIFTGLIFIFAFFLSNVFASKIRIGFYLILVFSIAACFFNLKIQARYDYAFIGRSPWDWKEYKYFISFDRFVQKENFSNYYQQQFIVKKKENSVLNITSSQEYARLLLFDCKELPYYFKKGVLTMDVQSDEKKLDFQTCIQVSNADTTILKDLLNNRCEAPHQSKWEHSQLIFFIRKLSVFDLTGFKMIIFIWNKNHQNFMVDNVKVTIE